MFAGGCTLESAEDVCEADLDTLASLLDKSLVRRRAVPDDADRYWMLETIREYATGKLTETGREDHVRGRQSDWLRGLAERAGFGAVVEWTRPWRPELVMPELDNVRDVLTWALENDPERGLELATSLEEFWVVREPDSGRGVAGTAARGCTGRAGRAPRQGTEGARRLHRDLRRSRPGHAVLP